MQKAGWEAEYAQLENLPSSRTMKPSRTVVEFIGDHPDIRGKALDMGSGKGRNTIFLAGHGLEVVGIEAASNAVAAAKQAAQKRAWPTAQDLLKGMLASRWPSPTKVPA